MHKKVLSFIKVLRRSFPDCSIVFRFGACYSLYLILKEVFPSAKAYFDDKERDHILTCIEGRYYDIQGETLKEIEGISPLTEKDHEEWESVADGQRVEYMLKKYYEKCKQ